jgi:hypothetical protein
MAGPIVGNSGPVLSASPPAVFSPLTFSGCVLWLDTKDFIGTPDSTAIATWTDKSVSTDNATQVTGTLQPLWRTNYLGDGNGALVFDGSDDFMSITGTAVTEFTIFGVTENVVGKFIGSGSIATNPNFGTSVGPAGTKRANPVRSNGNSDESQNLNPQSLYMVVAGRSSANGDLEGILETLTNGVTAGTAASTTYVDIGRSGSGLGFTHLNIGFLEIVVFNRALTNAEMNTMDGYFVQRWHGESGGVPTLGAIRSEL